MRGSERGRAAGGRGVLSVHRPPVPLRPGGATRRPPLSRATVAASVPAEPIIRVVVLAGGVGGAKLAHGMAALPRVELTVVANTGDDLDVHGLRVSPDVDTLLYTLAGLANPVQGWGLSGETWSAHGMFARYGQPTWFRIGDRDLATHVVRTRLLAAGETPTAVTALLAASLGVRARVLPMSDQPVRTHVRTHRGWTAFQDWFVGQRHADDALEVRFDGIDAARPTPHVLDALASAELIALAPSNPFVSIGTILALPGMLKAIRAASAPVVAVSPIVAGAALKGPADRMLETLGDESSALGIARHYVERHPGLLDAIVIDELDAALATRIEALGLAVRVAPTIMTDDADRVRLASEVLTFARSSATGSSTP